MASYLEFVPPQLPHLMPGNQLIQSLAEIYPNLPAQDEQLLELGSLTDAYEKERGEYLARNAHYGEWMQWYKQNAAEKERVVTFATEHSKYFNAALAVLRKLEQAVARFVAAWGDTNNLGSIRQLLQNVEQDANRLTQNLAAIEASSVLADISGRPAILPQKRPKTEN